MPAVGFKVRKGADILETVYGDKVVGIDTEWSMSVSEVPGPLRTKI